MEKELPKNWVRTELGEITSKPQYGWTSKAGLDGDVKYLRTTDLSRGKVDWDLVPFCIDIPDDISKYQIEKDDILISRAGSVGLSYRIEESPEKAVFASYLIRFKPYINAKLIEYYLKSSDYWNAISDVSAGIAVQNINAPKLSGLKFPLPPLAEQNRIVEKLDRLFAQLEGIKTSMKKIQVLLKNFRQQILTQAIISTDTIKLKKVLIDIKYGTSKKSDYEIIGTPILRIPNIDNGYINDSDLKFSVLDKKELETLKLQENDILIIRSNGSVTLVGQSAIVTKEFESYSYAGYLIRIRLNEQYDSKYLNYIFKSNFIRSQMIDTSRSTSGINNINSKEIQDLDVPNIKVEEQKEIVSRVESLFSKADAIEEKYKNLKAKIETLPQSILHKVFKGELSEQFESDGDAKDLLEEIMALKRMK